MTQQLLARITLDWHSPELVNFRLVLGIVNEGRLAPAEIKNLRPPRIVGTLLGHRELRCFSDGQRVDDRYLMIKTSAEAQLLAEMIDSRDRLPLMVLNTAEGNSWPTLEERTKGLGRDASGLARVVCLAWREGLYEFRRLRPELTPPPGSGLLIWPTDYLGAEPFTVDDDVIAGMLMPRLLGAAVSVFGGRDSGWLEVDKARRERELAVLHDQLMSAPDVEVARAAAMQQVAAKDRQLAVQKEEHDQLLQLASNEVKQLEEKLSRAQLETWRLEAKLAARSDQVSVSVGTIDDVQDWLARETVSKMIDLHPLLAQLETASNGAIVFTPNAYEECGASDYPDPRRMAEHLVALTRAADAYSQSDGNIGRNLHDWLADRGVTCSTLDDTLQSLGLHRFEYGGLDLDRTPHVKVDDHTHPDKVGRIYFAFVSGVSAKFIVDHIGQKLYLREGKRIRKRR